MKIKREDLVKVERRLAQHKARRNEQAKRERTLGPAKGYK